MLFRSRYYGCKKVAQKLGIEHKILYYQDKFKKGVIDNFVDSYLKGETYTMYSMYQTVSLKLYEVAKDLKANALITGHYVKVLLLVMRLICIVQ